MSQGPLAPIADERLVELTGAHVTTVRRWKRKARLPRWLARLVRVCLAGELDDVDRAWRGWKIRNGELVSPEGASYTPGAVRAGHLWKCRALELGALRRKTTIAIDADPVNNAHLDRLATLRRALEHADKAFEDVTRRLTAGERNRVYCSPAPAATPRPRILRRVAAQDRMGAGLLLQLVDPGMSPLDGPQHFVELRAHPDGEPAAHERAADEREHDALGDADTHE